MTLDDLERLNQRRRQNLRPRGPGQILVGHQDIASARARAYNGGLGADPAAGSRGRGKVRGSSVHDYTCTLHYIILKF